MGNIIGPDPAKGATTSRPARVKAANNIDHWFNRCSSPSDPAATKLTEDWFNDVTAALRVLIRTAGVTDNEALDDLVAEGVARYASRAVFGTAGGTANAISVTALGDTVVPKALFDGMEIEFIPAATNTAAATVAVFGLDTKPVVDETGAALTGGELFQGVSTVMRYEAGGNRWRLMPWARIRSLQIPKRATLTYIATTTLVLPGDVNKFRARVWGGGGGGGYGESSGCAGGGGGGGYSEGQFTTTFGATLNITVGAGGAAGTNGAGAGDGGTSSVAIGAATLISASGGAGGQRGPTNSVGNGGSGGAGSGGQIVINGQTGSGSIFQGGTYIVGGGGASPMGSPGSMFHQSSPENGRLPGGGGGGGFAVGNGGAGGGGMVTIEY